FEGLMHKNFQMSSMGEFTFFLGLQVMQRDDGILISQDKYVADILKKFNFSSMKTASTLIETNKALLKDEEAEDRIFKYLKVQPKLGLWYPKDSPFNLEDFSDSDYTGGSLDRKSTTEGCQFLGKRLISWQCKKQTVVANSTTEAEYVATANYYRQKKQKSRRKQRKEIKVPSPSSEIPNEKGVPITSNDPLPSGEVRMQLNELMILCTNLQKQVLDLEEAKTAQGRLIDNIDQDVEVTLVDDTQGMMNEEDMFGVNDLDGNEVVVDVSASEKVKQSVKVVEKEVSAADPVTLLMQAELEEEKRLARLKEEETNIALVAEWDNTQAMMDADCKLVARLQEEERGELSIEEKLRLFVELMDKRKKHFARLRAKKIRNKPPTKAQKRNQMCTYLKNMENYKHNQLKNKSFKEIQVLFNNTMKWIEAFIPMDIELVKGSEKAIEGSEKAVECSKKAEEGISKRARSNLEQEDAKRQRLEEENENAELKRCLEIILEDDDVSIEATPLSFKSPTIVDYKIYKEGKKSYFKIIRADGNSQSYLTFEKMFKNFNKEDLEVLGCKPLGVASLIFWQWQQPSLAVRTYTASGNSNLAVGMPCAFYSQQSSPKLDAPSAFKFSKIKLLSGEDAFNHPAILEY
nr:hypothetical protein [Tanacetum cinerariifolium]